MHRPPRRFLRFLAGFAAIASLSLAPAAASAEEPPPPPAVRWKDEWPRFSLAEGLISAAVTFRNGDLGAALDGPTSATIKLQVPVLDPGARALLRGRSVSARRGAARISDMGFRSLVLAPYVIDVALGALVLNRSPDVAAQLALIDFEVLTLAGLTQLLGSRVLGRARPYVSDCPPEGCSGGPYRSFLSGHAMASFTAAGLMCVHHKFLPLFGGGAPDTWACVWALAAASFTSTMRVVADEHWASDVLIGAGMGWLYGYYLPQLLHFHTKNVVRSSRSRGFTWMPTLTGTTESGVLGVLGTF